MSFEGHSILNKRFYFLIEVQTSCNRQNKSVRRRSSSSGLSSLPSRSFRYLQDQYNADNDNATDIAKAAEVTIKSSDGTGLRRSSDVHNPSRAFKYLQDQYHISQALPINRSQAINSRDDLIEIYHKRKHCFHKITKSKAILSFFVCSFFSAAKFSPT